ncbi:MAG: MarR family transcriptional regulator [Burkholderiales bacterium]|nr:MarR family transcriptional regulator [Burkholderiales bacterium]
MSNPAPHDESTISAHFASYSLAWKANDVAALLGHWTEQAFRFYKAEEAERFFTRFADVAAYFRANAELTDVMDVDFTAISLVPYDADMVFAIVHLQFNIRFARDARLPDGSLYAHRGKAMGGDNHVLALLMRTSAGWRFAGWSETPDAPSVASRVSIARTCARGRRQPSSERLFTTATAIKTWRLLVLPSLRIWQTLRFTLDKQMNMQTNIIDRALADLKREFPGIDGTVRGIVYSLFFLTNHFARTGGRILAEIDLSWGEYLVISTVRRRGARASLSPSSISESLGMSTGGVSNLLRRMEKRGLVKRAPCSRDGRGVRVQITARGCKYAEAALNKISANQLEQLEILPAAERARLYATLRGLVTQLETRSVINSLLETSRSTHTLRR